MHLDPNASILKMHGKDAGPLTEYEVMYERRGKRRRKTPGGSKKKAKRKKGRRKEKKKAWGKKLPSNV